MPKIARDSEGRITGFTLYASDSELSSLTERDRHQRPLLAALADATPLDEVLRDHPVTGRLRVLIEQWCHRRELHPLAEILPPYTATLGPLQSWHDLVDAIDRVALNDGLPEDERQDLRRIASDARATLPTLG